MSDCPGCDCRDAEIANRKNFASPLYAPGQAPKFGAPPPFAFGGKADMFVPLTRTDAIIKEFSMCTSG